MKELPIQSSLIPQGSSSSLFVSLLATALVIFALPRNDNPISPYGISGLDLNIPWMAFCLCCLMFSKENIRFPRGVLLFFFWVPFLMVLSNLMAFFFHEDATAFSRGLLQSIRRMPGAFLLIFLANLSFSPQQNLKILKWVMFSTFLGGGLFLLLANGFLPHMTVREPLYGNPFYLSFKLIGLNPLANFVTNYRIAGNTGSPSTYGLICGIELMILLFLHQKKILRNSFFYLSSAILFFLLMGSAAKAAIAITLAWYLICMKKNKFFSLFLGLLFMGFLIQFGNVLYQNFSDLSARGESSLIGRFDILNKARETLDWEFLLLGRGWRSDEIGWHNEILEILFGFGVPLGLVVLLILYFVIPWTLYFQKLQRGALISNKEMLILYSMIMFCSLFQDIFLDSNMLFFEVILLTLFFSQSRGTPSQHANALPLATNLSAETGSS